MMATLREGALLGLSAVGFHRLSYSDWRPDGDRAPDPVPVICVHGLTRNRHDFDDLAVALAARGRRVVCPDVVGRGDSDWLGDAAHYGYPQYLADAAALIARVDAPAVDWVGTSMGGLIGMFLAARANTPIRRLVLNDVGPFLPQAALERIAAYVGTDPSFASIEAVETFMRVTYAPFGPLSDAQWRAMAEAGVRRLPDGCYGLAYDPAIAVPLTAAPLTDIDLWAVWDAVGGPVLVLRGVRSDILLAETAREMTGRGPKAELIEVAEAGHAPALITPREIDAIAAFLATG